MMNAAMKVLRRCASSMDEHGACIGMISTALIKAVAVR